MLSTDRQTDRQTNKQTNATKNITSFAKEVKSNTQLATAPTVYDVTFHF